MVANTGTYVDAPWHRWADGVDLAGLPLERLADVDGVLTMQRSGASEPTSWPDESWLAGRCWSDRLGPLLGGPSGTASRAPRTSHPRPLGARRGVPPSSASTRSTSTTWPNGGSAGALGLLAAGIPIVEHLTGFDALLAVERFRFSAVPVPVIGMGTFPVRAYAVID